MKATGIVRRIDDLGRVVIPKEIRRTQRIREGDPLEIFLSHDGEVIFRKYSPVGELTPTAAQCGEVLAKNLGLPVLVCDRDHIVAAAGSGRKECEGQHISLQLEQMMNSRKFYAQTPGETLYPCEGAPRPILLAAPILVQGDISGAVVVLSGGEGKSPDESLQQQTRLTAAFLARHLES